MSHDPNKLLAFDELVLDTEKKVLWKDDQPVELPSKAVNVLSYLVEHSGEIVGKQELLDAVWEDSFVEENILAQNIYLIRKALDSLGSSRSLIETVPKRGYRFAGAVEVAHEEVEVTVERRKIEKRFYEEVSVGEIEDAARNPGPLPGGSHSRFPLGLGKIAIIVGSVAISIFGIAGIKWSFDQQQVRSAAPPDAGKSFSSDRERLTESERVNAVGLSQTGEHAAFTIQEADGTYSVMLHHIPTGSKTRIIEGSKSVPISMEFSPDEDYLYFARDQGSSALGVYRTPLYGGNEELVASGLAQGFSISPDGKRLAFYTFEGPRKCSLIVCNSRDCGDREVITVREGGEAFAVWSSKPTWSADGKKLLTTAETAAKPGGRFERRLMEIELGSGSERFIGTPKWQSIGQAYWSENESVIYVAAVESFAGPAKVFRLDLESGAAASVTADDRNYRDFRVAKNGDFTLGVTWERSVNLFLVDAEGAAETQLTFDNGISNGGYGIHWTPDGKKIVYVRAKNDQIGNLHVYDVEARKSRQITFEEKSFISRIDLTPDGKRILFGSNRSGKWHIWEIGIDGSGLRQVTDGTGESSPVLSQDGEYLYYVGGGLNRISLATGRTERLPGTSFSAIWPSPSDPMKAVSRVYAKSEDSSDNWKYALYEIGNPADARSLDMKAFDNLEWKPDGTGIYYLDLSESFNNIWFYDLREGSSKRITDFGDQRMTNLSLSPDGRTFAVARGKVIGNLVKISRKTGQ